MDRTIKSFLACGALAATLIIAGCGDSTSGPDTSTADARPVLQNISTNVILATYTKLDATAEHLLEHVIELAEDPNDDILDEAREAWREARTPWEQSEGFLFGPVDTKGIDPSIDSWPVNKADLDAVLGSDATLTKEYIDGLEGTLKGFHTIEYLLFGTGNNKPVASFTARELEYLVGVTRSFKGATAQLVSSWAPTGENFAAQLSNAGNQGSVYTSQKDALQELVEGMIGICDEVGNGKIGDPFSQQDRTLEESQFSDNSNNDFQDNIRSVRNVYRGEYNGTSGAGIGTLVAAKNPALDTRVRAEIDAAIASIGEMTPSFGQAIFNNKGKVEAAQDAILKLKTTLEGDVMNAVLEGR